MNRPILWYFADPMCSWCWGFSPVINKIREGYREQANIALVLGGLRTGGGEPVTPRFRDEILQHWHEVGHTTGARFCYEGAMPEGFVYDTEPASRAVISVAEIKPEATFAFFSAVQAAFYTENLDITQAQNLRSLAQQLGIDPDQFMQYFDSQKMRDKTLAHFHKAREFGVRGFPTLILETRERFHLLTNGYGTFAALQPDLDALLRG